MRIGIDARSILNPEKGEAIGVGHYTYQLIRNLLKIDKENFYVLFFDFRVREKDIKKFYKKNVKIKFYPFSHYKKYMPLAYNEILGAATLNKEKLDVLHFTSQFDRAPFGYKGKTIVTVHDLAAFKVPDTLPKIRRIRSKKVTKFMIEKSFHVITPSHFLKNDLKKMFRINEEKISVVRSGLDERFWDEPRLDKHEFLEKYSLENNYILFLGTLGPSKNITRLLQAFRIFLEKSDQKWQLVLAGKRGWLAKEYRQIAKDLGIEKNVKFIGYIVGDDLVPLYKYAQFFVLPSLYEGFGTTILESYAVGTPVITSSSGFTSEIVRDAACLVDPVDVSGISKAMLEFSKDKKTRDSFSLKGKKIAKNFSWEKCAKETLEIYNKINNQKYAQRKKTT